MGHVWESREKLGELISSSSPPNLNVHQEVILDLSSKPPMLYIYPHSPQNVSERERGEKAQAWTKRSLRSSEERKTTGEVSTGRRKTC